MVEKVTDIREAKKKKHEDSEMVLVCPECGCGLLWVYVDGVLECANCETLMVIEPT